MAKDKLPFYQFITECEANGRTPTHEELVAYVAIPIDPLDVDKAEGYQDLHYARLVVAGSYDILEKVRRDVYPDELSEIVKSYEKNYAVEVDKIQSAHQQDVLFSTAKVNDNVVSLDASSRGDDAANKVKRKAKKKKKSGHSEGAKFDDAALDAAYQEVISEKTQWFELVNDLERLYLKYDDNGNEIYDEKGNVVQEDDPQKRAQAAALEIQILASLSQRPDDKEFKLLLDKVHAYQCYFPVVLSGLGLSEELLGILRKEEPLKLVSSVDEDCNKMEEAIAQAQQSNMWEDWHEVANKSVFPKYLGPPAEERMAWMVDEGNVAMISSFSSLASAYASINMALVAQRRITEASIAGVRESSALQLGSKLEMQYSQPPATIPCTLKLARLYGNQQVPIGTWDEALELLEGAYDKGFASAGYSLGAAYLVKAQEHLKLRNYPEANNHYLKALETIVDPAIREFSEVDVYIAINHVVEAWKELLPGWREKYPELAQKVESMDIDGYMQQNNDRVVKQVEDLCAKEMGLMSQRHAYAAPPGGGMMR